MELNYLDAIMDFKAQLAKEIDEWEHIESAAQALRGVMEWLEKTHQNYLKYASLA